MLVLAVGIGAAFGAGRAHVHDVRLWSGPEGTRLVLDLSAPARYHVFTLENPDRVVIDLDDVSLSAGRALPTAQGPVRRVRSGVQAGNDLRIVLDTIGHLVPRSFKVAPDGTSGHRIVVEFPASAHAGPPPALPRTPPEPKPATAPAPVLTASTLPGAPAEPSAIKSVSASATGRDIVIAVDAGHGGKDPGAIGRDGTYEKHVTLAIARKLAQAIDDEDGLRAVLIRDSDTFVSLRDRIRKARDQGADMFVSIHADSVRDRSVGGSSVYVLSTRGASDEAARWLAERENAADLVGGVSLDDKDDVLASVLLDVTQKQSVSNSVEAASSVLASLRKIGAVHRTRVQHAGFIVLKSPDIPSMLVETAFISNPADEKRLKSRAHQQRIADAIHAGVRGYYYENPLPGSRVAALSAARRTASAAGNTVAGR
jgi:N-acetylmuramoyl-L-alanine amidase